MDSNKTIKIALLGANNADAIIQEWLDGLFNLYAANKGLRAAIPFLLEKTPKPNIITQDDLEAQIRAIIEEDPKIHAALAAAILSKYNTTEASNAKKKSEFEDAKVQLYNVIKSHIAPEAMRMISAYDVERTLDATQDPKELIVAVKKVLSLNQSNNKQIIMFDALKSINSIMKESDTVADWQSRVISNWKQIIQAGLRINSGYTNVKLETPAPGSKESIMTTEDELMMTTIMIKGLSPRYADIKTQLMRKIINQESPPTSTIEVVDYIARNESSKVKQMNVNSVKHYNNGKAAGGASNRFGPPKVTAPNFIPKDKSSKTCKYCSKTWTFGHRCAEYKEATEARRKSKVNYTNIADEFEEKEKFNLFSTKMKYNDKQQLKEVKWNDEFEADVPIRGMIAIDNQAQISVFNDPKLLKDIIDIDHIIQLSSTGHETTLTKAGTYTDIEGVSIFPIYVNLESPENIISQEQFLNNMHGSGYKSEWIGETNEYNYAIDNNIKYVSIKCFGGQYLCKREKSKLKKAYATMAIAKLASKDLAKRLSSKEQLQRAAEAHQLRMMLGFPSVQHFQRVIFNAAIMNADTTTNDVQRAADIYGKTAAEILGRETWSQKPKFHDQQVIAAVETQDMFADVAFIRRIPYLIGVVNPLGLVMATQIKHTSDIVAQRLMEWRSTLVQHGITIREIHFDAEGAKGAFLSLPGIVPYAPGQHVGPIERKIRVIKERYRILKNHMKIPMSDNLVPHAINWIINTINMIPPSASPNAPSAFEFMHERKLSVNRDLTAVFGDIVIAKNKKEVADNNADTNRGILGIYLGNTFDKSGSSLILKRNGLIATSAAIQILDPSTENASIKEVSAWGTTSLEDRENIEDIISKNNRNLEGEISDSDEEDNHRHANNMDFVVISEQAASQADPSNKPAMTAANLISEDSQTSKILKMEKAPISPQGKVAKAPSAIAAAGGENPLESKVKEVARPDSESSQNSKNKIEIAIANDTIENSKAKATDPKYIEPSRVSTRRNKGINKKHANLVNKRQIPSNNKHNIIEKAKAYFTKINENIDGRFDELHNMIAKGEPFSLAVALKSNEPKKIKGAKESIKLELENLIETMKALIPIHPTEIRGRSYPSKSIIKEKFKPDGEYEKTKGRIALGGHRQNRDQFDPIDLASPTANHIGFMAVLTISVYNRWIKKVFDVKSAFLHASMIDPNGAIYMKLDKATSEILIDKYPEYGNMADNKGIITCHVNKAMYGSVQASSLWYIHLIAIFQDMGFKHNSYDACIMYKKSELDIIIVVIHVDDVFITGSSEDMIQEVLTDFKKVVIDLVVQEGETLNYLGTQLIEQKDNTIEINMKGYTEDLVSAVNKIAPTPHTENLFEIDESSPPLLKETAKLFHTTVAKLVWLNQRVRFDIAVAVSFLTSRVASPNEQDFCKLTRVLRYLNGTKASSLRIAPKSIDIHIDIDASFGTRSKAESQYGYNLFLGNSLLHAKSAKLKFNVKSSTEAETIATSESVGSAIWINNLLACIHIQGKTPVARNAISVGQDNQSCIRMHTEGPKYSSATRHLHIKHFWLRNLIDRDEIVMRYTPTEFMTADFLTKPLAKELFYKHIKEIGIIIRP